MGIENGGGSNMGLKLRVKEGRHVYGNIFINHVIHGLYKFVADSLID